MTHNMFIILSIKLNTDDQTLSSLLFCCNAWLTSFLDVQQMHNNRTAVSSAETRRGSRLGEIFRVYQS